MPSIVNATTASQIPTAPVDDKLTTVYWDICGLGQPVRYALECAGVDYVDVRVHWGPGQPGTEGYKQMWASSKGALGERMPFPNLPYMLDGDVALTQSNAILKYIGRKYGLLGDPSSEHLIDLVLDQAADFDAGSTRAAYGAGLPGLREYCEARLPGELAGWAQQLADKAFMTGDEMTVADLKVYETLRKLAIIEAQPEVGTGALAAAQPSLLAFMRRVESLPAMKQYQESSRFMARPLNNEHAKFK